MGVTLRAGKRLHEKEIEASATQSTSCSSSRGCNNQQPSPSTSPAPSDPDEGNPIVDEEEDDEVPDYEPYWKRAKKVPPPPVVFTANIGKVSPRDSSSPALTVLYDRSEEQAVVDDDHDSDVEEVAYVKVMNKTVVLVSDDEDDEDSSGKVKRRPSERCETTVVATVPDEVPLTSNQSEGTAKSTTPTTTTDPENYALTNNGDIVIIDVIDDSPLPTVHRKRPPITASLEEIVPEKYRTLYFEFRSTSVSDDSLWTSFSQFGEIERLHLNAVPESDPNKEGHVTYKKFYAIDSCFKARPLTVDGAEIVIRRTEEKLGDRQDGTTLYVSGIFDLHTADIHKYFSSFGRIMSCTAKPDRGFAFVKFEEQDAAEKAFIQQYHNIGRILVEVKRAMKQSQDPRQRPRPRDPYQRPKYDRGPRARAPAAVLQGAVTPFPRHVEVKPKLEPGAPSERSRNSSASSATTWSNNIVVKVKTEPAFPKREPVS